MISKSLMGNDEATRLWLAARSLINEQENKAAEVELGFQKSLNDLTRCLSEKAAVDEDKAAALEELNKAKAQEQTCQTNLNSSFDMLKEAKKNGTVLMNSISQIKRQLPITRGLLAERHAWMGKRISEFTSKLNKYKEHLAIQ